MSRLTPWIGVDLDGTLAEYHGWQGPEHIGPPVPIMLARVRLWLAMGVRVKVFTARAADPEQLPPVLRWLEEHGLGDLEVTNVKDHQMIVLWDDRCVRVISNTGEPCCLVSGIPGSSLPTPEASSGTVTVTPAESAGASAMGGESDGGR